MGGSKMDDPLVSDWLDVKFLVNDSVRRHGLAETVKGNGKEPFDWLA